MLLRGSCSFSLHSGEGCAQAGTLHSGDSSHFAVDNWHNLRLLEIFHLHFIFTEPFPAQTFPALAQGCSQLCKAQTSHPSRELQTGSSQPFYTDSAWPSRGGAQQYPVPDSPKGRLGGILCNSHGHSSGRLRLVAPLFCGF